MFRTHQSGKKKSNRKSLSDDFSMFRASPTSSPNLSVKKSIHAHKSLIQWSFPVKRVKCYLIECAVSYQRETARPSLTIHITRVTCIQVHVKQWRSIEEESRIFLANFRLYWIYSDCLDKSFLSRNQKIKLHFCFEKLDLFFKGCSKKSPLFLSISLQSSTLRFLGCSLLKLYDIDCWCLNFCLVARYRRLVTRRRGAAWCLTWQLTSDIQIHVSDPGQLVFLLQLWSGELN